ncbi:MAG: SURF1 family protein [Gammaproteobacteria bacterium]|nr:MAG: SURF1 family protein [Gammaproteobacteria bacterium]
MFRGVDAIGTAAMAACAALFVALGCWQLDRAAEKRALAAAFATAAVPERLPTGAIQLPRYRPVIVQGRYDSAHQFLLDNMTRAGRAGVEVLTPLVLADGRAVLVNRGWLPLGATRDALPEVEVPAGDREISGRIDHLPRPGIELAALLPAGWPKLVSFPRMEELESALGRELHPQLILLDPASPDGYARDWRPASLGPERHLAYAVQWFALAATAVVIWIVLGLRRVHQTRRCSRTMR